MRVSAPGVEEEVAWQDGDTVQLVAQRATAAVGGRLPQQAVFILDGNKAPPHTVVPQTAQRLTVGANADNG